jgi:hypothetical protein
MRNGAHDAAHGVQQYMSPGKAVRCAQPRGLSRVIGPPAGRDLELGSLASRPSPLLRGLATLQGPYHGPPERCNRATGPVWEGPEVTQRRCARAPADASCRGSWSARAGTARSCPSWPFG